LIPSLRVFLPIVSIALLLFVGCTGNGPATIQRDAETSVGAPLTAVAVKDVVRDLMNENRIVPGELDLKLVDGEKIEPIIAKWNLALIDYKEPIGFYHFALPQGRDLASTIAELRQDPRIEVAEPIYTTHMNALRVDPNDTRYAAGEQWYLENMDVPEAWVIEPGDPAVEPPPAESDVVVAVLDTGMDYAHPDLKPDLAGPYDLRVLPGFDYVNGDSDPQDDNGHGTMICGMLGAKTGNSSGVASIGWNARIMPVKVLDQEGNGTSLRTADGIMYAMNTFLNAKSKVNPFDILGTIFANPFNARLIINMSYTYETPNAIGPSQMELAAVKYAINNGALLVAAAGDGARPLNNGSTSVYPASYPGVIAVGSTDQANNLSPDSNTLPASANPATSAFFVAPGVDILSTYLAPGYTTDSDGFAVGSGTSFSAACVSGVISLIWSQFPFLAPAEVIETLAAGADPDIVGTLGADLVSGRGLVNALHSLEQNFTPNPTDDPIIIRAFTNPILHGDIMFVIRTHYQLLTAVESLGPDINEGFAFTYHVGWDVDLDGIIDVEFPHQYVLNLLQGSSDFNQHYWRHEVAFGQLDSATYIGRLHLSQDLTYQLVEDPYKQGQLVIEFIGIPHNYKADANLPMTISAKTTLQVDKFNYDLPG
jgi:subtilisin family serine protease